jgi:hypothetical protein
MSVTACSKFPQWKTDGSLTPANTLKRKSPLLIPFLELRGLSPSFHIHVSVSDLYISRIGPHNFMQQNRQIDRGNLLNAHRHMNVEIGTQFLFSEYVFRIFGIGSLQCRAELAVLVPNLSQLTPLIGITL